jgi:hypothetical protein
MWVDYNPDFGTFKSNVFKAFQGDCDTADVSLFAVRGNEPVTERTRITAENFAEMVKSNPTTTDDTPLIYFFNSTQSPQGSPVNVKASNINMDSKS